MKRQSLVIIALSLILGLVTGCSDKDTQQTTLDPSLPVIAMSDLLKQADKYAGKTITVTGLFGGMCSDGADFYFKDKLELIEVVPPADGMPTDIVIGTPLKVQGVVLVQAEHGEEGGEKESEVKIQATVIHTNRS
tara:strand:+ start:30738 stop:31142 length:405 start_codon:yes stop_codon:yes gene_type:complete